MFLATVMLIIAIIFLTIHYIKINAKTLSREEFIKEAVKNARKKEYQDPILTCEYCGVKIDTAVQKGCPNCGGSYANNKKWLKRHNPDLELVEKEAEKIAEKKLKEAEKKTKKIKKYLKISIITLFSIIVLLILIYFIQGHYLNKCSGAN